MIVSDDTISFKPNGHFDTQNSIIYTDKYLDSKSNESLKELVNNELKSIDKSNTDAKEITFCHLDNTGDSDSSVSDEESDFEPVNVFIPRFRGTNAFRGYSSLASNKLKNYSNYNSALMRCSLPCKKISIPSLNLCTLPMTEENKFSDRKYSYVRQSLNVHNKVHISNFFSTLKK